MPVVQPMAPSPSVVSAGSPRYDASPYRPSDAELCNRGELRACLAAAASAPDAKTSTPLLERACAIGDAPSCYTAAYRHYEGKSMPTNPEKAFALFSSGCKRNDPWSCGMRALLLERGVGTDWNLPAARSLNQAACRDGAGFACFNLGRMQRDGRGGPKDPEAAHVSFGLACGKGLDEGCREQEIALLHGRGVNADPARALPGLDRRCEVKNDGAVCAELAWFLEQRKGPGDAMAAERYDELGCERKNRWSCSRYAAAVADPSRPASQRVHAIERLEGACEQAQSGEACAMLTLIYLDGVAAPRSVEKALARARRACWSDAFTCGTEAWLLREGVGTPPSRTEAVERYQRACSAGARSACAEVAYASIAGYGPKEDVASVLLRLQSECQAHDGWPCIALGRVLVEGTGGVKVDVRRGMALAERACRAKVHHACVLRARWRLEGAAGTRPDARARTELERLCRTPFGEAACIALADHLRADRRTSKSDRASIVKLLGEECEAKGRFGLCELAAEQVTDRGRAITLLRSSCERGFHSACEAMGDRLMASDPVKARTAYRRACDAGLKRSCELAPPIGSKRLIGRRSAHCGRGDMNASGGGKMYGIAADGKLRITDLETGVDSPGPRPDASVRTVFAFGDKLFVIDDGQRKGGLLAVDLATGATTEIGTSHDWLSYQFAAGRDRLYAINSNDRRLYVVDPATGSRSPFGADNTDVRLAFPGRDGGLWIVTAAGELYAVDVGDGSRRRVGAKSEWAGVRAGAVVDGKLYTNEGSGRMVVTDLATGARSGTTPTGDNLDYFEHAGRLFALSSDSLYEITID